jgi:hypothetical protein
MFAHHVYISHSPEDDAWVARELLPRLEGAGLDVQTRDNFTLGKPRSLNIQDAVSLARRTVVVLSQAWLDDHWTDFEGLLAGTKSLLQPRGTDGKREYTLLPVRLVACDVPLQFAALETLDLTDENRRPEQLAGLVQQLQRDLLPPANGDPPSPFVAGPPITNPGQFFGRKRELTGLFSLWKSNPFQNAAIIGPLRSGKTSLLLHLKAIVTATDQARPGQKTDWLKNPASYRWVFVDFQDPRLGTREGFLRHLLQGFGYTPPTPCGLNEFLNVAANRISYPTVVVLDEIGVALRRWQELDDDVWNSLRSFTSHLADGRLGFVLAAHEDPVELAYQSGRSSPFFNIFGSTAWLKPFTAPEAMEVIASSPIPFPPADAEWIVEQSRRWPFPLELLCRERYVSLEAGESGSDWRDEGLRQIQPYMDSVRRG